MKKGRNQAIDREALSRKRLLQGPEWRWRHGPPIAMLRLHASKMPQGNESLAVRAIEMKGQRLPDAVLVFSGVEAPAKK